MCDIKRLVSILAEHHGKSLLKIYQRGDSELQVSEKKMVGFGNEVYSLLNM